MPQNDRTSPADDAANLVTVDPNQPNATVIARAGQVLRAGGIVSFPTETVYGLGANALDAAAVERVFRLKGRPSHDPLIVHLAGLDQLDQVATDVPPIARVLAARFWPGPLTLVLRKRPEVPDIVTAGLPTVGVRVPSHPVALALIRAAGVPIAAPSANLFSRTSATTAQHVLGDFGDRIDLVVDGGPAEHGIESTVLDVSGDTLRLLRPGATALEAIAEVVGSLPSPPRIVVGATHRSASPGLARKHYAPKAEMLYFTGPAEAMLAAMARRLEVELSAGRRLGLLLASEDVPRFQRAGQRVVIEDLGPACDARQVGRRLYAALRRLDQAGVDVVLARSFGETGIARALHDRLTRAASGNVVDAEAAAE